MPGEDSIERFLSSPPFAVVGASNDPSKYGHRVFRAFRGNGELAYPVNPNQSEIDGEPAFASLADLPEPVKMVSVITPPEITEQVVEEAASAGAEILWLQPGAESGRAISRARELGITTIHGGPCVLVLLGRS